MFIKHCIVGGGISGLYIALQLHLLQQPFCILEGSEKPHTKLESTSVDQGILEMGASVFHSSQHQLLSMIDKFGLTSKIKRVKQPLRESIKIISTPEEDTHDVYAYFECIKQHLADASESSKDKTIDELAHELLDDYCYQTLVDGWDCWYEVKDMNAHVFFQAEAKQGRLFMLEGGLKQLIKKGWEMFEDEIQTNFAVQKIERKQVTSTKQSLYYISGQEGGIVTCQHVYVCIGLEHIPKIHFGMYQTLMNQYVELASIKSCMRYYILFEKQFEIGYDQVIGNIIGHWWIQVYPNVWMIYCDGEEAEQMNELTDEEIEDAVEATVQEYFQMNLPAIKRVIRGWWPTAFEVLRPSYYHEYESLVAQIPFLITSLPHPAHQAWMEGHLYSIKSI